MKKYNEVYIIIRYENKIYEEKYTYLSQNQFDKGWKYRTKQVKGDNKWNKKYNFGKISLAAYKATDKSPLTIIKTFP